MKNSVIKWAVLLIALIALIFPSDAFATNKSKKDEKNTSKTLQKSSASTKRAAIKASKKSRSHRKNQTVVKGVKGKKKTLTKNNSKAKHARISRRQPTVKKTIIRTEYAIKHKQTPARAVRVDDPVVTVKKTVTAVTTVEPKRNWLESIGHGLGFGLQQPEIIDQKILETGSQRLRISQTHATHFGYRDSMDSGYGSPLFAPVNDGRGVFTNDLTTAGVALPRSVLMPHFNIHDFRWSSWQKAREAGVKIWRKGMTPTIVRIVDEGPHSSLVAIGHGIDVTQYLSLRYGGDGPMYYQIIDGYFQNKPFDLKLAYPRRLHTSSKFRLALKSHHRSYRHIRIASFKR